MEIVVDTSLRDSVQITLIKHEPQHETNGGEDESKLYLNTWIYRAKK